MQVSERDRAFGPFSRVVNSECILLVSKRETPYGLKHVRQTSVRQTISARLSRPHVSFENEIPFNFTQTQGQYRTTKTFSVLSSSTEKN